MGLRASWEGWEPAGRASEPAGRASEPAGRASEPAGRPGDRFQHTLDVLAGIKMGLLNSRALEHSIDMLNYV